ncbi:FRG domain-containing protein [Tenacibaculum finnmarkense]|uniref:FRG domain-containing protein n=1 Tax=Tenacibaculum finnmarkense TaxID=2781243 RepID=UPI003BB5F24F
MQQTIYKSLGTITMNLPEYDNLKDKSEHFNVVKIDSIDEFKNLLAEHSNSKGIYRGVSSSKYKIYTSLQRQHLTKNIKGFNNEDYLSRVRNNSLIKKYFETFKIPPSKLSIWSYLQHYGAPTPYIDFSTNFAKSMYFAVEKFKIEEFKPTDDFSDRFSIYFIENTNLDLITIPKVIESFKEVKRATVDFFENYDPSDDSFSYDDLIQHLDRIFDINVLNIFLIDHNEDFVEVYNTYNNIRIVAQEGLFINNTYSDLPLEEALKKFFIEATQFQHSPWDEIDSPQADKINKEYQISLEENRAKQKRLIKNIITSYDIKKEIIPDIKKIIGIHMDDIYPDQEKLVWDLYNNVK